IRSVKPFKAPIVESLSVRVVVDSVFDQFMPKATHPMVAIEHVGRIRSNLNSTLAGEWGLSLHLESRNEGETGQYLLDFGYTSEVLLRNFGLLGIEPERLNGLILSHGHRDHYGGLPGFVAHYRDRMRSDLQLFAGGKETFGEKWIGSRREEPRSWGALHRAARRAAGARTCAARPRAYWRAHSPPATSRASRLSGYCPTLWSNQPQSITSRRMSGAGDSSPTGIPMSMPPAMSCKGGASSSFPPAAIAGCSMPSTPRWRYRV